MNASLVASVLCNSPPLLNQFLVAACDQGSVEAVRWAVACADEMYPATWKHAARAENPAVVEALVAGFCAKSDALKCRCLVVLGDLLHGFDLQREDAARHRVRGAFETVLRSTSAIPCSSSNLRLFTELGSDPSTDALAELLGSRLVPPCAPGALFDLQPTKSYVYKVKRLVELNADLHMPHPARPNCGLVERLLEQKIQCDIPVIPLVTDLLRNHRLTRSVNWDRYLVDFRLLNKTQDREVVDFLTVVLERFGLPSCTTVPIGLQPNPTRTLSEHTRLALDRQRLLPSDLAGIVASYCFWVPG